MQAFRRTELPLQRIRRALDVLSEQDELHNALASRNLFTDGADVLYDYATGTGDGQLRLLTVVSSAEVAGEGWVALTKDVNIVRDHQAALRASDLRAFALSNANIAGDEMARRYAVNLHRILQRCRKPGPYVDVVHPDRVERRWPAPSTR